LVSLVGVLIKSPAIGPGVVVTSSILISVRVTIWAVGCVAVALLVHALTISVDVGATPVTAPTAATCTGSVSVSIRLVGTITGGVLVPLVSFVRVAIKRPLIGSGVVITTSVLVLVTIVASVSAIGCVVVAGPIGAVIISIAGHDQMLSLRCFNLITLTCAGYRF